jgi:hypothetical protein
MRSSNAGIDTGYVCRFTNSTPQKVQAGFAIATRMSWSGIDGKTLDPFIYLQFADPSVENRIWHGSCIVCLA